MSWIVVEYLCPACGIRIESLEARPPRDVIEHCFQEAPRVLSATYGHVDHVSVSTSSSGSSEKPPDSMSTVKMGDGQSREEFKAERKRHWQNKDFNADADSGLRDRKVFV